MRPSLFVFGISVPAIFVLAFTACGGGGGNSSTPPKTPSQTQLTGVVASGAPLVGYAVSALSASELASKGSTGGYTATTDANGSYTITIPAEVNPPFVISATKEIGGDKAYPRLLSIALSGGTANINPLTDLEVARLSPLLDYNVLATVTAAQIEAARQAVVDYLLYRPAKLSQTQTAPVDASKLGNFITQPMQAVPTDSYDAVLEQLQQTMVAGENISSLEVHMLERNLAPLDLQNRGQNQIYCQRGVCSTLISPGCNGMNCTIIPLPPYLSKYALVKRLAQQINSYGITSLDCGTLPLDRGKLLPNINTFSMDETVLRFNNLTDDNAISVLGADFALHIATASFIDIVDITSNGLTINFILDQSSIVSATFSGENIGGSVTCN